LSDTIIDSIHINFNKESLWALNAALALVMFGIALEISISDFKELLKKPKPIFVGVLSQFILLPALTFLLVLAIKPLPSVALGMIMVAACPGGNISNFITHIAKGNSALSICLTAVATLLAIFMTPLNLEFWSSLYPPTAIILTEVAIEPLAMIELVFVLLGIPLIGGMLVNYYFPFWAKKVAKILKIASLGFFVVLIFIALYANRIIFFEYVLYVFWIVVLHNLVAFLTGFSIAKVFGLSTENIKTITIETGIQNSGLGLLLIFTFFDGLGGMALLTAFWGIWHLVSGLLLATFWSSKTLIDKKELV
jgi:BASS family bile acid:Na+ symporter